MSAPRKEVNVVRANDGSYIVSASVEDGTVEVNTAPAFTDLVSKLEQILLPQITHEASQQVQ